MPKGICSVEDCERPELSRGLCNAHYQQFRRSGQLQLLTAEDRFFAKIHKTETCWLWTGSKTNAGYGLFYANGRLQPAHRWSYEHFVGPIPDGFTIDHVKTRGCTFIACVNPAHLEAVTQRENTLRGTTPSAVAVRTGRCKRGHSFNESNTYWHQGKRHCKACRHTYAVERYRRRQQ